MINFPGILFTNRERITMNKQQSIPYSILDLAPVTRDASFRSTLKRSLATAQYAESTGYTRYWVAEHHNMPNIASSATTILMGYLAGGTNTIRIGSGGIMLPNHSPLIISEQIGTLARLYPGRIDLGLGRAPGTDPVTARAIRPDRQKAVFHFEDELQELQNYFRKDQQTEFVHSYPAEGADVPFWLLGSSTDSAYLAARLGLPYVFASHFAPDQLLESLSIYRDNFIPSEQLHHPYTIACIQQITAPTDEEAELLASSLKLSFLGIVTGKREPLQPPLKLNDKSWGLFSSRVNHMLQYAIIGSTSTTKDLLSDFLAQTKVDEIMVSSMIYDPKKQQRSFQLFAQIVSSLAN